MASRNFPFLSLPPELRNRVYQHYFATDAALQPPPLSTSPLALALTCRQLYNETVDLAFRSTTFRTRTWRLPALRSRSATLPRPHRLLVERLEMTGGIEFASDTLSSNGVRLADAGLTAVQELYINFTGQFESERDECWYFPMICQVLLETITASGNSNLRKIRLVHGGSLRWNGLPELYSVLEDEQRGRASSQLWSAEARAWRVHRDIPEGCIKLAKEDQYGMVQREVVILFGYTIREAELYRFIQADLLKGNLLDTVTARLLPGTDAADLDNEALAFHIDQISRAFKLPPTMDTGSYY